MRGTLYIGLVYDKSSDIFEAIVGYVDLDYVGYLDRKRSLTGHAFTLCGSVINWKATLKSIIALSTIVVEYIVAIEVVKETIWLKGLFNNLGLQQELTDVYFDSQNVIHLKKNLMFHKRTKHIDIKMHFIRDVIAQGAIVVKKNPYSG